MATLTYAGIETRVMNALRIPTSNSTEATKVAALINEVYRDIGAKYNWWWLVKRGVLATVADISTGTVSVTNNDTAITFSSAPTPDLDNRVFIVTNNTTDSGAAYRISAHTAGAAGATLDGVYTGATDTAASYKVYGDTLSLATDVSRILHIKRYGFTWPLTEIGYLEMLDLKTWDQSVGKPEVYSVFDSATSGDPTTARRLIVHPYPDEIYRLEYHYKQTLNTELSGTTRPLIPDDYVEILVYGALARGYPIFLNDTARGQFFQGLFNDMLSLMTTVQREHEGNPRVVPRDDYRRFYSRGRRISPATADLGDFFDRYPMRP